MKIQYTLVLFVVISLTLFACTETETPPQEAVEPSLLRVGWANWPGYYPLIIGIEKGFFAEQGLTIEVVSGEDQSLSNFLAKKLDASLDTIGEAMELEQEQTGSARLVMPVDYSDGGDVFLAVPEINSPADLKGQTIGLLNSPFSLVFANAMLKKNNLTLQTVNWTSIAMSDALSLLSTGKVQAIHVYEPTLSQGIEQGYQVIYSSEETPGLIIDVFIVRAEIVEERPDDVKAFVDGWFATVDWWEAHPDEGNAIMAEYLKKPVDEISTDGVAILNREVASRLFDRNADDVTSLYETAELYKDVMTKLGVLTSEPNLDVLIDPSFIE